MKIKIGNLEKMVIKELDTPMNEKANIINLRDELIDVKNSPIFETD